MCFLVRQARSIQADLLVSVVHQDNDPMQELNAALGGTMSRRDRDYMLCRLDVNSAPC
jgi:hypothetical protein